MPIGNDAADGRRGYVMRHQLIPRVIAKLLIPYILLSASTCSCTATWARAAVSRPG